MKIKITLLLIVVAVVFIGSRVGWYKVWYGTQAAAAREITVWSPPPTPTPTATSTPEPMLIRKLTPVTGGDNRTASMKLLPVFRLLQKVDA